MTNYEYILIESKKAYFAGWNKKTMEGCVFRLRGMTRQDLLRLFNTNAYRLVIS